VPHGLRLAISLTLLAVLAACGSSGRYAGRYGEGGYSSGNYAAPGPEGDPWGPYIREAASRFNIPERWIREVMRQESGGHQYLNGRLTTSSAGAMGLMQLMPSTYAMLRDQYGLGSDPYDPHDNIMAGAAYIKQMYDQFGSPGFLAAYNAGPGRVSSYLASREALPSETVNYVASIAPRLGAGSSLGGGAIEVASAGAGGCDLNAAYDPSRPCVPAPQPVAAPPPIIPVSVAAASVGACDPDAAYDPNRPCAPVSQPTPAVIPAALPVCDPDVAYDPATPCRPAPAPPQPVIQMAAAPVPASAPAPPLFQTASAAPLPPRFRPLPTPPVSAGRWGVQVGAFRDPSIARATATDARGTLPGLLGAASVMVEPTTPFGGVVLYRARLIGVSAEAAGSACASLQQRAFACMLVKPGQS
jgi:hypothetical protein